MAGEPTEKAGQMKVDKHGFIIQFPRFLMFQSGQPSQWVPQPLFTGKQKLSEYFKVAIANFLDFDRIKV